MTQLNSQPLIRKRLLFRLSVSVLSTIVKYFWRRHDIIYIFLITIAGIVYSGYSVASNYGDDQIYLLALFQKIDPSLYQNDYLWLEPLKTFSFFIDLEIMVINTFSGNLIYALFFLYFISKFLMYLGIYKLSLVIFQHRLAAFGAILTLFLPFPLPRTIPSHDVFLAPRMLVLGVALFFLKYLIQEKFIRAGFCYLLLILVYPVFAFLLAIISGVYLIFNRKLISWKTILLAIAVLSAGIAPYFVKWQLQHNLYRPPLWVMPFGWEEFYKYKAHYLFFKYWKPTDWRQLALLTMPLGIFILLGKQLSKIPTKRIRHAVAISAGIASCLLLSFLFINIRPTPFIIRMEPTRALIFAVYLGFIGLSGTLITASARRMSTPSLFLTALVLFSLAKIHVSGLVVWASLWIFFFIVRFRSKTLNTIMLILLITLSPKLLSALNQPHWYFYVIFSILVIKLILTVAPENKRRIAAELTVMTTVVIIALNLFARHIQSNFPPELYYAGINPNKLYWREYLQNRVHFPELPRTDWFAAQQWVKDNTPANAIILVPESAQPGDLTGFRVFSKRAITFDMKDGSLGTESEQYALEWLKRYKDLSDNESFSEEKLQALNRQYHFSYILRSRVNPTLNFPVVYQNTWFLIYQLPSSNNSI